MLSYLHSRPADCSCFFYKIKAYESAAIAAMLQGQIEYYFLWDLAKLMSHFGASSQKGCCLCYRGRL